jgi:excisionase family DNA binding protein
MKLVTTKEIADRYGVHPKTVLKWVNARVLPVVRINRRCIRFDIPTCDGIMKNRTQFAAAL